MNGFLTDLKSALRGLAKNPRFTAVAVLTLALGVGANTALFSVVDAVLFKPLPFRESDRLVRVTADAPGRAGKDIGLSLPELQDLKQHPELLAEISGLYPIDANVTEVDEPERVEALLVDVGYFEMLGVGAQLGRTFTKDDFTTGITEVGVISDAFWRRRFGADPHVLGKRYRLDNDWYTVIGVAPAGFRHPGRGLQGDVEVWSPAGWTTAPFPTPAQRGGYVLRGAIARIAPGLSLGEAQSRLDAVTAELARRYPDDYPAASAFRLRLVPLHDDLVGNVRSALLVLLGAVALVLLIACANVANLLLAKASARGQEMAVKQALGAGSWRLARQLLTESLVLALAGGAAGLAVAAWGVNGLVRLAGESLPRAAEVRVNGTVLLFTLAVSVATALLFGLAPAREAARPQLAASLKDRGTTAGRPRTRLRRALVVSEFALAFVLLVAAGLLVRSFRHLMDVDTGFDGSNVLTAGLWLPQPNQPETGPYFQHPKRAALFTDILRRVSALPGVVSAAGVQPLPFTGAGQTAFVLEGHETEAPLRAQNLRATPGYFETMRIPLERGRLFTAADDERAPSVAVVSRTFARTYYPGADPVGKRLRFGRDPKIPWTTIVGVVGDVRTEGPDTEARPQIYRCLLQSSSLTFGVVAHAASPASLGPALRREVRAADPDLPLYGVRTVDDLMARTLGTRRFAMLLLGFFAGVALLLSAVGIYGVTAYAVEQRTHELGVRMALGATAARVQALVVSQGLALTGAGVAIGLAGAALLTRPLAPLLYGVGPRDPLTFAGLAALLTAVAVVACLLPARRAARLDPIAALRRD